MLQLHWLDGAASAGSDSGTQPVMVIHEAAAHSNRNLCHLWCLPERQNAHALHSGLHAATASYQVTEACQAFVCIGALSH